MIERQARIEAALTAKYQHYKDIARYPSNRITWAECVERYPDDAADERGAIAAALDAADAVGRERVSENSEMVTDAVVERAVLTLLYAKDDEGEKIGVSSCFMPTHWMREIQHVPNWNTPNAVTAENESNRRFEHRIRLAMRSALEDAIALLTAAPAERGHDETGGDAIESGSVERAEWESAQRNGYVWDDEVKP